MRDHLTAAARARLDQDLQKIPYALGNHWLAQKGDQRIHIIGTQHSGDARMFAMMRQIRPVIEQADAVFLEVTEEQMQTTENAPAHLDRYILLPRGQRLDRMMSAEDWHLLSARLAVYGIPAEAAAGMQPWYLSDYLTGTDCTKRGIGVRRGLDDRIERAARRAATPTLGLEAPETGLAALAAMPLHDQLQLLLLDLKSKTRHADLYVTLSESYFDDRLTEGRILMSWMIYRDLPVPRAKVHRLLRSFDRQVLEKRNRAWAKRLQARPEKLLVVAVGAAHLAGNAGLLNLLAQRGYTLSRVTD
ncbi:TraB/GumN family protein [Phaeobacter sp. HF9A]|nr:TraB/GumN family protein [Phaeobacter sp. HF9A]